MDTIRQDLRHAVRRLTRRPALAAAASATLALGIGANAAVFGLVEGLLLRPLPFREPERLVMLWQTAPGNDRRWVAPANFLDWREARSVEGMAALLRRERNVTGGAQPTRIDTASVSGGFFELLGVRPAIGPGLRGAAGSERRLLVLSHGLWRSLLGGDPGCVGRRLSLDGEPWEIAGVMPAGFAFPEDVGLWTLAPRDVPNPGFPGDHTAIRDARFLDVVARLAPGVELGAARAELAALAARLERAHPEANADTGINPVPLREQLVGETRGTLGLLAGVAGLVLLVGCLNVANLLLADATRRRTELAVRVALGAARGRVLRQLLMEAALLGVAGGVLGVLLASWAGPLLAAVLPEGTPPLPASGRPGLLLAFSLGLGLLTTAVFGALPALAATRRSPAAGLRAARGDAGRAASGGATRGALVVVEVAVAVVLVCGAGLLARTLWNLSRAELGFDPERVVTARVSLPAPGARPAHEVRAFFARVSARLEALPGVERAAAGVALPLTGRSPSANVRVEGIRFERAGDAPDVSWRAVTPGWFETLGLRLVRGRLFDEGDAAGAPVAVVNETLAGTLWPGEDPLGRRLGTGLDGEDLLATVVGVVADTPQERAGARAAPEMLRPLAQESRRAPESLRVAVRLAPGATLDAATLREAVWGVDPEAPVTAVESLEAVAGRAAGRERAVGLLLGLFAGLALVLACVGLYGVLACAVGERVHEIGVRLALGASPARVRRLVLGRGLALAGAGVAAGLAAAAWASRLVRHLLYGVEPLDGLTFGVVALALLAVAAVASLAPARRASRVDPLTALRAD